MNKETFDALLSEFTTYIEKNINYDGTLLYAVLCAYNQWQEDERDGVDYIFNIYNNDDLKCCIEGGLNANDISLLVNGVTKQDKTNYFFFGCNHPSPLQINNNDGLIQVLVGNIGGFLPYVFVYPSSYGELYSYVSAFVLNTYITGK